MRYIRYEAISDERAKNGRIMALVSAPFNWKEITVEELQGYTIFNVVWVRWNPDNPNVSITMCDDRGNRMRVASPNSIQVAYGFNIRFIGTSNFIPEVGCLDNLPLSAPLGVVYNMAGNVLTVEQARAQ